MTAARSRSRFSDVISAFDHHDMPRLLSLFSEDVVWSAPGNTALSGTRHGRDELADFFAQFAASGAAVEVIDDLVDDTHGVLFLRVSSQQEGKDGEVVVAQFSVADADGRFARSWFLPNDMAAFERMFPSAPT